MENIDQVYEINEWILERFALCRERLEEIYHTSEIKGVYADFFKKTADIMLQMLRVYDQLQSGDMDHLSVDELAALNKSMYEDILPDHYALSYTNPTYARQMLGEVHSSILSWLAVEERGILRLAYQNRLAEMTALIELFVEIYAFYEEEEPDAEAVRKAVYWYVSDYSDQTLTHAIREQMDPELNYYKDIVMHADLTDLSYLYQYGDYIGENEIQMAAYLNSLDQCVIDDMARTFVEGYIRGFEIYKIDLSVKKNVQIRANIGFERVIRSAVRQFEAVGLASVIQGEDIHSLNRKAVRRGLVSCMPNPQYHYDHKADKGLFLDKALCERIVGVTRMAYDHYKDLAEVYAGPAVMEIFGEIPFEPEAKDENVRLSEKQEHLMVRLTGQLSEITNQYIDASSISFTIIAWPVPSIGQDFEAIMKDTIAVNNLDNDVYRTIQQTMIDTMDGAAYVHIVGMNGNETDLKVALWQLQDPEHETVFENCCADVNIPVGEIFTSPVLKGTEGTLHVSEVYLNELKYRNLKLSFTEGCIASYSCTNYEDEDKNNKYIRQNLLQNRETLPMGEFAIGTNTTAFAMARQYGISGMMPILIMEKTGPHFAVGDTCYSHSEDHKVYNPDGKEIVARENEISHLRLTDMEKAYFNVHTDITIPYDEIGSITACFADGSKKVIIQNGRFCLDGTEALNAALDEL